MPQVDPSWQPSAHSRAWRVCPPCVPTGRRRRFGNDEQTPRQDGNGRWWQCAGGDDRVWLARHGERRWLARWLVSELGYEGLGGTGITSTSHDHGWIATVTLRKSAKTWQQPQIGVTKPLVRALLYITDIIGGHVDLRFRSKVAGHDHLVPQGARFDRAMCHKQKSYM